MVDAKIPLAPLSTALDFALEHNDDQMERAAANAIVEKIHQSKQPFILVDTGASRYSIVTEVNDLVKVTGFPTATAPVGKGVVDETLRNFHGVYGTVSDHVFVDGVKNCDLVLYIGPFENNVNTYYFKTIQRLPRQSDLRKTHFRSAVPTVNTADGLYVPWDFFRESWPNLRAERCGNMSNIPGSYLTSRRFSRVYHEFSRLILFSRTHSGSESLSSLSRETSS